MKPLDKYSLYEKTGWLMEDCEILIHDLRMYNLIIIDSKEYLEYLEERKKLEDDFK